jgi:diguanylate cyclase (GGDEF)-like protein
MLDELAKGKSTYDTALLIDIDHFSDINDGLGQEVGNNILLSVYKRLEEAIGTKGTVARIGADIFGILSKEADFNYERVLECFVKPISAQEHIIPINVTIGGSRLLSTDQSGISVLKHANIALNRAKKDISSRFSYYQVEMEDETSWRLGMIRRLNTDFEAGKLQVWFQPQICVKSKQIIGMEALLRWPDGNGGFISPATFIPLAEYSGLIVGIGAWVIKESCKVLKQLNDGCFKNLRVAVNVSMPQFRNPSFVDNVLETVKQEGVPPQLLELEITESVVMDDPKLVVAALDDLKRHGFSIAIDDFGTGFSSLSYLQQLPLDRIKVDREFIKDIGEGGDGIIAETVIKLGQKLGLETIAEGIETQEQLDYIESLGCDESQGFLHAKPMPVKELEVFLKDYCKV